MNAPITRHFGDRSKLCASLMKRGYNAECADHIALRFLNERTLFNNEQRDAQEAYADLQKAKETP